MNLENICEGLIVKNYKEMCALLEETVKGGDSKKSQLKEWERYMAYHKEGNKFIVDEVYCESDIKEKQDNRGLCNNAYGDDLKTLILCILAASENIDELTIPTTLLLKQLHMVNVNYSIGRRNQEKLSKLMCMDEIYINEFYNTTHTNLQNSVETALKQLVKMKLIDWNIIKMVCKKKANFKINEVNEIVIGENMKPVYTVKESYEPATKEEGLFIMDVERLTLLEFGCDSVSEIFKSGRATEYYNKVNEIIRNKTNIIYYFNAYNITYNSKNIFDKLSSMGVNASVLRSNINKMVQDKMVDNAVKRNDKALDEYYTTDTIKESKMIRVEDNYLENMKLLIKILIDIESSNICKYIKEIE